MPEIVGNTPSRDALTPLTEAPLAVGRLGGCPPNVTTMRGHGYQGRFDLIRLPSGKLAVRTADLPAIARLYGATEPAAA